MPGTPQVALAGLLLVVAAALSWKKRLHLEKDFLWGGLRMGVQLVVLGLVLQWIFTHPHPLLIIGAAVLMSMNAGLHSTSRVKHRYPGLITQNLLTTFLAVWPLSAIGVFLLAPNHPLDAATLLPLLGMVLGNALNGITLGLDHYTETLKERQDHVTALIALGATPAEATHSIHRQALRKALTPVFNSMYACGIISIPGMMTGQMLAGAAPLPAAIYQFIIMVLISCGGFLGAFIGLKLCERKHFDARGALC